MLKKSDVDKLDEAADLCADVVSRLNVTTHGCASCGTNRYENYDEYKLADQLRAMTAKLTKIVEANTLQSEGNGDEYDDTQG